MRRFHPALIAALVLMAGAAEARTGKTADNGWVRGFAAAPMYLPRTAELMLDHQTVRIPVRMTIAGHSLRLRLSNEHGREAVTIARASILRRGKDGAHLTPVTFGGEPGVTMAVGAPAISDAVAVHVTRDEVIEVSLYVSAPTVAATIHRDPNNAATISTTGDFTATADVPSSATTVMRPWLAAVDVVPDKPARTIVTLGDSISDWDCTFAATPCQWQGELEQRLAKAGKSYAIANIAISADRILLDGPGAGAPWDGMSALARFDRDVLSAPDIDYLLVMMGINDIGMSGRNGDPVPTAEALIAGLKQIIARAHAAGIRVYGAEILPFKGASYASPEKEQVRLKVNEWIRTGHAFDGLLPFSQAIADPADPARLKPEFNNGDNLHPNAAGQRAMGDAIDLKLFR